MKTVFSGFKNRKERAIFIEKTFRQKIQDSDSILDVGCSENELKNIVGEKVFGIDVSGSPDKFVNLEKECLLCFSDKSFDLVVCTEVLEHIDNFHQITEELKRVSRKYILISLPNCSQFLKIARILLTGKTGKFYGLPAARPEDRHKWFFSWKEADNFFENFCNINNLTIEEKFLNFNYSAPIPVRIIGKILQTIKLKSFANDYWILIKKS